MGRKILFITTDQMRFDALDCDRLRTKKNALTD